LRPETIDVAVCIVEQFMRDSVDTHLLLLFQNQFFPICEQLISLLPTLAVTHFTPLWFFFLALINYVLRLGSNHLDHRLEALLDLTAGPLSTFLRAFALSKIAGAPTATLETLQTLDLVPMCTELLVLLSKPGIPAAVASSGLLSACPFLWPSALTWAIISGDDQARPILSQRPPNVPFMNDLFYQASVCVAKRPSPWLLLLDRPDCRLLRRFCPESIGAIHFFLASDISALVSLGPPSPKLPTRILLGWRAWLKGFGLEQFVRALLYVLIWNIQVGTDPLSAMASFRSAGCIMVVVCEADTDMLLAVMRTAIDLIENDDCGVALNGDGVAEFCLIMTVAVASHGPGRAQEMFRELLQHRKRLVDQGPPAGTAKLGFCISGIRGALYVPSLRELIEPGVFGTAMMRQEWQAAIDYFIASNETGDSA
jgi:hypothetical protein